MSNALLSATPLQKYIAPQMVFLGDANDRDVLYNSGRIYGTILLLFLSLIVFIGVKFVSLASILVSTLSQSFKSPINLTTATFSVYIICVSFGCYVHSPCCYSNVFTWSLCILSWLLCVPSWLLCVPSWLLCVPSWLLCVPSWSLCILSWLLCVPSWLLCVPSWLLCVPSWLLCVPSWLLCVPSWLLCVPSWLLCVPSWLLCVPSWLLCVLPWLL